MDQLIDRLTSDTGAFIALIAISGSLTIATISIIGAFVSGVTRHAQSERTRREIAAYVAEGSMTPEQGERLLSAGVRDKGSCCG